MATKKERAQRLLDSLDSAVRIKKRLWLAIAQGVIISLAVTWFTRWQFGVAASLVFVLLIQLAYERMTNSIAASKLQALNDLGWSTEADSDEQLREKAEKYFHDGVRMQHDAALYLQFIEVEEGIAKRRLRMAALILSLEVAALLWLWIQGTSVPFLGGLLAVCCLSLSFGYRSHVRQSWAREETMLEELGIDLELLEEGSVRRKLVLAAETGTFNQVQVEKMTGSIRGQDDKGFTGGIQKDRLDSTTMRRDVKESAGAYEGLEGDLRRSERLVNEANERYGAVANEQWSVAESKDQDLIEAGVERLGDLVRTDWFEKNAKDGAVDELMGQGQKE